MSRIKKKLNEYWRVLRVTKKPDAVEYKTIVKVSALGMAAIGAIGFFIQLTWEILG
ncbi:MAG: protein translocase SEC61 complex subunit gamma [Candidatus Nanoarchaeia archaeon]